MSARAQRTLLPVAPATHRQLGLLEGWTFFRVPQTAGLRCMCGAPARFAAGADGSVPRCIRHARDF